VFVDPASLVYNAIKSTRGNNKATDQQIVDLVRSVNGHREFDDTIELFAKVLEEDGSSSNLPFLLYAMQVLDNKCTVIISESDGLQCVEYQDLIPFAAKLFCVGEPDVKKCAIRAIQLSHTGEIISSKHARGDKEMTNIGQLEFFFEKIWRETRVRDDEAIKFDKQHLGGGGGGHGHGHGHGLEKHRHSTPLRKRNGSLSQLSHSNSRKRSITNLQSGLGGSRASLSQGSGGGMGAAASFASVVHSELSSDLDENGKDIGKEMEKEKNKEKEKEKETAMSEIANLKKEIKSVSVGEKRKKKKNKDVSKSPLIARRTLKLLEGGRRQSIMEIGGGVTVGMAGGGVENDEDMNIGLETLGEGEEKEEGGKFELGEEWRKEEVKAELWHYHSPVGKILSLCDELHHLASHRLKHAVWSTILFDKFDKYNKNMLNCSQFIAAMCDSKPKRSRDELEQLYSDLVYVSENGLMTYGTFRSTTLQLCEDGLLVLEELTSDNLLESAHGMSQYKQKEKGW